MKVLVTRSGRQVGRELVELLGAAPHHEVLALGRDDLDISDRERHRWPGLQLSRRPIWAEPAWIAANSPVAAIAGT